MTKLNHRALDRAFDIRPHCAEAQRIRVFAKNCGLLLAVPCREIEVGRRVAPGRHERLYTFAQEDLPVELVTVRVDASGDFPLPQLPELPPGGDPGAAIVGHQPVSTRSAKDLAAPARLVAS